MILEDKKKGLKPLVERDKILINQERLKTLFEAANKDETDIATALVNRVKEESVVCSDETIQVLILNHHKKKTTELIDFLEEIHTHSLKVKTSLLSQKNKD